jgi:hypothetical protein
MRVTMRHYYDFGADKRLVGDDLVSPASWDALRVGTTGPFSLPATREEWERAADERPEIRRRAEAVLALADRNGAARLVSYGVGGALLELWMQRLAPERQLVLTDYGPETVERLRALGAGAEVIQHDLLGDPPPAADLHLFHRIDTELTDSEWHEVMQRFSGARVLVAATEIIDLRRVMFELRGRLRRSDRTRAGWIRTRSAFEALWAPTHVATALRVADLEGWLLEPRG